MNTPRMVSVPLTLDIYTGRDLHMIPGTYPVRVSDSIMETITWTLDLPRYLCGYQNGPGWIIVTHSVGRFLSYWHPGTGKVYGVDPYIRPEDQKS